MTEEQRSEQPPSPPSPTSAAPPHPESFLLKDLDTGMRSYVTDQEWVEKPTVVPKQMDRKQSTNPPAPKPPIMPPLEHRWADRHAELPKRTRSDELHSVRRALRASDHVRVVAHKKRDRDFTNLYRWQRIHAHSGPIRVMEFNKSGRYLATAGQDCIIKIWDIDTRLEENRAILLGSGSPSHSAGSAEAINRVNAAYTYIRKGAPLLTFKGHTSDVLTLSWSKNDFLLSGSVDRTIRLWHPRAKTCLRRLIHSDIVTCVAFHPTDEQICISGSANGEARMWHLKESKLLSSVQADDLITACVITPDGTTALMGTYHGRCKFYALFDEIQGEWQLKPTTQLDVRSRRAKNAQGKKICGFRFLGKTDKVMISSNDSRLRLYRLDDKSVLSKFLGHQNNEAHLNASFAPGQRFVLCGAETRSVHIWEVDDSLRALRESAARRPSSQEESAIARKDRSAAHESFVAQDSGTLTAALFAPKQISKEALYLRSTYTNARTSGLVIVTASDEGDIRVFGCC